LIYNPKICIFEFLFELTECGLRMQGTHITYTQAGVSGFVGKESAKFKVQFFAGSSVVKIPACV
jgi:hypothetical protein